MTPSLYTVHVNVLVTLTPESTTVTLKLLTPKDAKLNPSDVVSLILNVATPLTRLMGFALTLGLLNVITRFDKLVEITPVAIT